ncbi:hypothetical protein D3C85_1638000 [compost metagenome]
MVALTVVLHDELPVALFDDVLLVGDFCLRQIVGREVGLEDLRGFIEVGRRLARDADEN